MTAIADPQVDWAGTAHPAAGADARIACLVPSITELLFSLDLGERVVARTGFCVHPREAVRRVAKIGGTKDPDLDRLRASTPTHLIVNVDENRREVVDAARAFVPHVIVTHPLALSENPRLYRLIGAVFDQPDAAEALCDRFLAAQRRLRNAVAPLPTEAVLYLIWKKPWMTVGADTYIADVLATAGWKVVAADDAQPRYPVLDDNDSAWMRAQRILLSSEPYAFRARDAQAVSAARNRPADVIDGEMTSWYGPRAIAGMDYLGTLRRQLVRP
ncbi:MAG: helical backbone metal receptor [Casimicrobiaceae bacterium]